jgi:hypothetical protein
MPVNREKALVDRTPVPENAGDTMTDKTADALSCKPAESGGLAILLID